MFGYISPARPYLYIKDLDLYKAMYCGICKSMGKYCGQISRLTLNYDVTFLSVFLHNVAGEDVEIKRERCAVHWLKRRPVVKFDGITERLASLNVILAYYKLTDDIEDENRGKFKRIFFKRAYKRAAKKEPSLNKIVNDRYCELSKIEKENCSSLDYAAEPFAMMMKEICREILQEKGGGAALEFAYNVGKWLYLIDALDDFEKDKKSGSYNVFVAAYPDAENFKILINEHRDDIYLTFSSVISKLKEVNEETEYKFNRDLTDNIVLKGIPYKTEQIIKKEENQCKKTLTRS